MIEPLLYNCFENNTKNQREKFLNGKDIYGLHFQGDGEALIGMTIFNDGLQFRIGEEET